MSGYTESQLRDMLAENLWAIEPGLQLLNTEQWLRNSHGAAGSMDLFAQDRHDLYVVIEVKRSRSTAREAVGEVTKYTRLLTQEHGIPRSKIRIAVVTMTADEWHELLVPFSDFAQVQSIDVRGYSLVFDAAGEIAGADQVELLRSPAEQRITPIHYQYFFLSPEEREAAWQQIRSIVGGLGIRNFVGVDVDCTGDPEVAGPFSLYVAFGTSPATGATAGQATQSRNDDCGEPSHTSYPLECDALSELTKRVFYPGSESAGPEKFTRIEMDPRWHVRQVRGTGVFERGGLRSDKEIRHSLAGEDGDPGLIFGSSANTKVASDWQRFRSVITRSSAANEELELLVTYQLDELERADEAFDVALSLNNQGDLMKSLTFGYPDQIADYEPRLYGLAGFNGTAAMEITGTLRWNGRRAADLVGTVRRVYPDPTAWMLGGGDSYLLDKLGLHYALERSVVLLSSGTRPTDAVSVVIPHHGKARPIGSMDDFKECGWDEYLTLGDFVDAHRHEVRYLVDVYRMALGR